MTADNRLNIALTLCKIFELLKDLLKAMFTKCMCLFGGVFYSSDGFEGDLLLWVKMLLPGVNKRVYNLQSKQLIKLFSQVKIKHRCACKSILKKN